MKNEVFEANPLLKQVYTTSDGENFYQENDAKNHAKSLEDKAVETIYNPTHLEVVGEEVVSDETSEMENFLAQEKLEAENAAKEAEAQALLEAEKSEKPVDLLKLNKAKLLEFAKENGLTVADETATNKELVAELTAQINTAE